MKTNHAQDLRQSIRSCRRAHARALEANGVTEDMLLRTATNAETSVEDTRDMESRQHVEGNGAEIAIHA